MTTLIIFRHGETMWNKTHRVMGKVDIPLNQTGKIQAEQLAQKLKYKRISTIYTSPLKRAVQTAKIVSLHKKIPLKILPELEEMSLGMLEGKTKEERTKLFPWFVWENDNHRKRVRAETLGKWARKFHKIINHLQEIHKNETIAMSTHEWKMKSLLLALNFDKDVLLKYKFKNCANIISIIKEDTKFEFSPEEVFKINI